MGLALRSFFLLLFLVSGTDAGGHGGGGGGSSGAHVPSPRAPPYIPPPNVPYGPYNFCDTPPNHSTPPYTPLGPYHSHMPRLSEFVNKKQYRAYLVIQRFKKTITSDPKCITKTWVGPHVCNYMGFTCEAPPNAPHTPTIATVDFNGFTLEAPTICGFINELPDLALFHVNTNNFFGTIPLLHNLPFLYELDVSNNKMAGLFPTEAVTGIRQLQFLDLRYNSFTGFVPQSVFSVPLSVLFVNNNPFGGSQLPANLGKTTSKYLTLANNGFTGSIPWSIGYAANTLVEVLFLNNSLSGCLPHEIGYLKKATVFDAGTNQITGTIPKSFGCLLKMEQLNLANNLLHGEVPDVVCRLHNLRNLSLSNNYFTSLGGACYHLLKQGRLDVENNCIPGLPDQRPPKECHAFSCVPKSCPTTSFVPCKLPHYGVSSPPPPPPTWSYGRPKSSPSYSALHPHP